MGRMFQPYTKTCDDRYPLIFRHVRDGVRDGPGVRILAFGCSTGEEILSIRRYFKDAQITGLDINPHNIAQCRKLASREALDPVRFEVADSTLREAAGSYDVIFAMAVFRHGDLNIQPPPQSCESRIRFSDFEEVVEDLTRCLKPGGYLIIRNAMFRFRDTRVYPGFSVDLSVPYRREDPRYGPDNRLIEGPLDPETVFKKRDV